MHGDGLQGGWVTSPRFNVYTAPYILNPTANLAFNSWKSRMDDRIVFIVYAPRYDDTSGGAIVLHKLCHLINNLGEHAYIWPMGKPPHPQSPLFSWFINATLYYGSRLYRKRYSTRDGFLTPFAQHPHISNAVAVYPEITKGNPLGADHVVRWLLYNPSFYKTNFNYAPDELCFYYQPAFDNPDILIERGGQLSVVDHLHDIYFQWNHGPREGICYIIRKGKVRSDLPKLNNLFIVDNLAHKELASIFNRYKYCYSYDSYTMYTTYAALCGCIPVIIPLPGISKEDWQPVEDNRYGHAYGMDDIEYAVSTRDFLSVKILGHERENLEMTSRFISVVKSHFNI